MILWKVWRSEITLLNVGWYRKIGVKFRKIRVSTKSLESSFFNWESRSSHTPLRVTPNRFAVMASWTASCNQRYCEYSCVSFLGSSNLCHKLHRLMKAKWRSPCVYEYKEASKGRHSGEYFFWLVSYFLKLENVFSRGYEIDAWPRNGISRTIEIWQRAYSQYWIVKQSLESGVIVPLWYALFFIVMLIVPLRELLFLRAECLTVKGVQCNQWGR